MDKNLATLDLKAFVPARDFELSKLFYQSMGFELMGSAEGIAHFRLGDSSFLLQDFYSKDFADNFMMYLRVENVEDWYQSMLAVAQEYQVKIKEPEARPWGIRDFHLLDPSGVLWHIGQPIVKI